MIKSWKLLLLLAACTSPSFAFADERLRPIVYDCDTAANHFSELALPAPDGPFVVSGHVQINQIPQVDKFVPLARFGIAQTSPSPGSPPTDVAGFILNALPSKMIDPKLKDSKAVVQYVEWDELTGGVSKDHAAFGFAKMGEKLDFSLSYADGIVTARISGQEQRIAINAPLPVVRIICSTGEFVFTDLRIEKSN